MKTEINIGDRWWNRIMTATVFLFMLAAVPFMPSIYNFLVEHGRPGTEWLVVVLVILFDMLIGCFGALVGNQIGYCASCRIKFGKGWRQLMKRVKYDYHGR